MFFLLSLPVPKGHLGLCLWILRRADASPGTFGGSARNQTRIKKQSRRGLSLGQPPSATIEASLRSLLSRSRRHSFNYESLSFDNLHVYHITKTL